MDQDRIVERLVVGAGLESASEEIRKRLVSELGRSLKKVFQSYPSLVRKVSKAHGVEPFDVYGELEHMDIPGQIGKLTESYMDEWSE